MDTEAQAGAQVDTDLKAGVEAQVERDQWHNFRRRHPIRFSQLDINALIEVAQRALDAIPDRRYAPMRP